MTVTIKNRHLSQLLHELEFSQDDDEPQRTLDPQTFESLIPPPPNDSTSPPICVLIVTINKIISPSIIHSQIPNLLRILQQVDRIRSLAHRLAKDALTWNKFYETRGNASGKVFLLDAKQKEVLKPIAKGALAQTLRALYVTIVTSFCCVHIYRLWTASDSFRLPSCMREYFPSMYPTPATGPSSGRGKKKARLPFDSLNNETERQELHDAGLSCKTFIAEAGAWERMRKEWWQQQQSQIDQSMEEDAPVYMEGFSDQFPPLVDESNLVKTLKNYLEEVEDMVDKLEEIFVPSPNFDEE